MKLLFDQNLSHRLVQLLGNVYPNCAHVTDIQAFEIDPVAAVLLLA